MSHHLKVSILVRYLRPGTVDSRCTRLSGTYTHSQAASVGYTPCYRQARGPRCPIWLFSLTLGSITPPPSTPRSQSQARSRATGSAPSASGCSPASAPWPSAPAPPATWPQTGGDCCLRAPALAPAARGLLPALQGRVPWTTPPKEQLPPSRPACALALLWFSTLYCLPVPRGLESSSACSPWTPAPRTVPSTLAQHEPVPTSWDHPSLQLASEHCPRGIPFWGHSWPPRGDWHLHRPPSPCPHLLCHSPASQSQFPRGDHNGRNIPLLPGHRPPANPV